MNRERLTILADFLDALPEQLDEQKRFDMNYYWLAAPIVIAQYEDCETVGCALGWAATIPAFQQAGFCHSRYAGGAPSYLDRFGISAATAFFGLSETQAIRLFMPGIYRTRKPQTSPTYVAAQIRKLLATL